MTLFQPYEELLRVNLGDFAYKGNNSSSLDLWPYLKRHLLFSRYRMLQGGELLLPSRVSYSTCSPPPRLETFKNKARAEGLEVLLQGGELLLPSRVSYSTCSHPPHLQTFKNKARAEG